MKQIIKKISLGVWVVLFELHLLPWVKRSSPLTRQLRLATCPSCPIFVKRFSRCGPIRTTDPVSGRKITLGCRCFMKVKSKVKFATCWARDNGLNIGWADEINGRNAD